ncbi:hypothetical protein H2203_002391 [Taxawa tesnikishii (nom. ined.)]|nr:hypothetical protein H2203_002391 [Dothideales sp. JES 119]
MSSALLHEFPDSQQYMNTSGASDAVWVHTEPYNKRPHFDKLKQDLDTEVCVIGSGITGVSTAYELVKRGLDVVLVEAREILSGETGRTSGHLANALDDGYTNIKGKFGDKGAAIAAESHTWALEHVGDVAKELGIECEYRKLPGYEISQYERGEKGHDDDIKELKEEVAYTKSLGMDTEWRDNLTIKGWDGKKDQRDGAVFNGQATFHPTKYVNGILKWLGQQPNFKAYTRTRVIDTEESDVKVITEDGHTIHCKDIVMATCVPLQKLSIIAEMEYDRTYCIAIRVPKGSYEDCLLYDTAENYKYIRFTECDEKDDYLVIGGLDHKVGQAGDEKTRYAELETWVRERYTQAGSVDYKWSGQIYEPFDYMAFIGLNPHTKHTYIMTGDSGNGLTHGVLGSRLIADQIQGVENPWTPVYDPNRTGSILKSAKEILPHDLQINAQYKRFLQSDINDIEDLAPGSGGVLNPKTKLPIAVYKTPDELGLPVHGSRFSKEGICVIGPAKGNLEPKDESAKKAQRLIIAG